MSDRKNPGGKVKEIFENYLRNCQLLEVAKISEKPWAGLQAVNCLPRGPLAPWSSVAEPSGHNGDLSHAPHAQNAHAPLREEVPNWNTNGKHAR